MSHTGEPPDRVNRAIKHAEGTMNSLLKSCAACVLVFCASASVAAADEGCAALDRAVTDKLKPLIERSDARSTAIVSAAVTDLGWARLNCREGRVEHAETGYRYLIDLLAALAPPSTAKAYAPKDER
jgi:hypothetical protein